MSSIELLVIGGTCCLVILCIISAVVAIYTNSSGGTIFGIFGADNAKCKEKYKGKYSEYDNVFADGGNCYICDEAHPDRTIFNVLGKDACEGSIEKIKAAKLRNGSVSEEDSKRMFHDPLAGVVGICADNTNRNLTSIHSETPCTGTCESIYGKDSFQDGTSGNCFICKGGSRSGEPADSGKECQRSCEAGYAADPNGSCFKCPEGTNRTIFMPVESSGACDVFGKPNSGVSAIFGRSWLFPWESKGSLNLPLKFKESNYTVAKKLGSL
jgi:hypothetical protein